MGEHRQENVGQDFGVGGRILHHLFEQWPDPPVRSLEILIHFIVQVLLAEGPQSH